MTISAAPLLRAAVSRRRVYAKCIAGRDEINRRRIEEAFRDDSDRRATN